MGCVYHIAPILLLGGRSSLTSLAMFMAVSFVKPSVLPHGFQNMAHSRSLQKAWSLTNTMPWCFRWVLLQCAAGRHCSYPPKTNPGLIDLLKPHHLQLASCKLAWTALHMDVAANCAPLHLSQIVGLHVMLWSLAMLLQDRQPLFHLIDYFTQIDSSCCSSQLTYSMVNLHH